MGRGKSDMGQGERECESKFTQNELELKNRKGTVKRTKRELYGGKRA